MLQCTATAKHRRLPASTWKEWVAKDCVVCKSPVPFERCSTSTILAGRATIIFAGLKWRRKRQAHARELTLARQAAEE